MEKQKTAVEGEIEQLSVQIQKLEEQITNEKAKRSDLQKAIEQKRDVYKTGISEMEGYDIDQMTESLKSIEKSISSNNKKIRKYNKKVDRNNKTIQKLMKQNDELKVEIALLTSQNETAEKEAKAIQETIKTKNLTRKAKRLSRAEKDLARLQQQRLKLDGKLEHLNKQKSEAEMKRNTALHRLETIVQTLRMEQAKLN
ncbi:hypothetical protein [Schleiferia thermophila]|uniref:hypothetical protein n=1 Tax=Schleiferia thermophila TaxID=884107 RepID=UPI000F625B29|nr:hypothetical protein [Schleiferia thermophila]